MPPKRKRTPYELQEEDFMGGPGETYKSATEREAEKYKRRKQMRRQRRNAERFANYTSGQHPVFMNDEDSTRRALKRRDQTLDITANRQRMLDSQISNVARQADELEHSMRQVAERESEFDRWLQEQMSRPPVVDRPFMGGKIKKRKYTKKAKRK